MPTVRPGPWLFLGLGLAYACSAPPEPGVAPGDTGAVEVDLKPPAAAAHPAPITARHAGTTPANRVSSAVLNRARALMPGDVVESGCGPYRLVTDAPHTALQELCSTFVAGLDAAYAERFLRAPVGSPAETLFVFARGAGLGAFTGGTSRWRIEATGRASAEEGFAALAWEGRDRDELATTLVHELTHLVNRRALGPALPAWLEEGLADDLADRLVGGKFQPAAWRVGMDRAAGDLPSLADFVAFEAAAFYGEGDYSNYAQALAWVRFLSGHPELAARFDGFLDALAAGAAYSPGMLRGHLGRSWEELEGGWGAWIRGNYSRFRPFDGTATSASSSRQTAKPSP